ncbi:NADH-quinone oxidoreductase subunit NuoE [Mycolicibacterium litorale]|uniref:NADH-quinone oxidoreductase subunit NuoE n=1 Tax=Mycolicibacterium litorale TaxID=758802 RepID=UPI003CEDF9EE
MTVFLSLGQRPEEPGPPITGPAAYPPEVAARLADDAARIVARYPQARSALLPLLHLVQSEDGCLTPAGIAFCAGRLGLTDAEVTAVATFYSMYRRTPTGDYLVGVCTNTLCAIMGGDEILDALQDQLGVHAGQTTGDGRITLEHIECNAACDYAPVVMVNWEFFDNQTPASARDLVDALRGGTPVTPTRGAPLCTFRETSRTLAGLADPRAVTNPGGTGEATLAGLRVARANGMAAPDADSTKESASEPDPSITEAADSTRDEPAPAPESAAPPPVNGSQP